MLHPELEANVPRVPRQRFFVAESITFAENFPNPLTGALIKHGVREDKIGLQPPMTLYCIRPILFNVFEYACFYRLSC